MSCAIIDILKAVEQKSPERSDRPMSVRSRRSSTVTSRGSMLPEDAKKIKDAGGIVSVRFVDRYAVCWSTGKPPGFNYSETYNNSSRIMVLCEHCLLFYDYVSGIAHILSAVDLQKPPTAAEFVAPNFCAVGCSDGQIRIWDCSTWSGCKSLACHTKGNGISWLKMLSPRSYNPIQPSKSTPAASDFGTWGGGSADMSVSSLISGNGLRRHEEKPRLFSVSIDGGALVWDLAISGTGVSVLGGSPAGHLLSLGCFAQVFDDTSDTLFTVAADRTIRLWDLGSISKGSGVVRSARRRSSFLGTTSSGSEAGKITCVGKAKPRSDLSSPIAKFTSCTVLEHPRFASCTFAVSAKTDAIGLVNIYESTDDNDVASERSSITNSESAKMKYNEMQIFRLTTVLTEMLVKMHEEVPDANISAAVIAACRDTHTFKVYSVQAHMLYPNILVACTTLGVVALSLFAPGSPGEGGSHVVTHPSWRGNVIMSGEHSIKLSSLRMDTALSAVPSEQTGTPSRPRSIRRRQLSRSLTGGTSGDMLATSLEGGVILDTIAEYIPNAAPIVPGGNTLPVGLDRSSRGRSNSLSQNVKFYRLAVSSTRPTFYPSCSGLFCAAYWPDSHVYAVFKVGIGDIGENSANESTSGTPTRPRSFTRGSSNMGGEKMQEVDRGMCASIGWCTVAMESTDNSDSSVPSDLLCLITLPKRLAAPKKRESLLGTCDSCNRHSEVLFIVFCHR